MFVQAGKKIENLHDIHKQCVVVAAIQVSLRVILGWILTSGAGGKKLISLKMKRRLTCSEKIGFTVQSLHCATLWINNSRAVYGRGNGGKSQCQDNSHGIELIHNARVCGGRIRLN